MAFSRPDIKNTISKVSDFLYRDLYYTIGYSCLVGLGNGLANSKEGNRFDYGFGEGFVNNFGFGLVANSLYPIVFNLTSKSKHFKFYSHASNIALNTAFLAWHFYIGTENPIAASAPCYLVGSAMTELQLREIQQKNKGNIEDKLKP